MDEHVGCACNGLCRPMRNPGLTMDDRIRGSAVAAQQVELIRLAQQPESTVARSGGTGEQTIAQYRSHQVRGGAGEGNYTMPESADGS